MTFSLVILSHEKPRLLNQAIESALCQTRQFDDILIVDSGSLLLWLVIESRYEGTTVMLSGETTEEMNSLHVPCWVLNKFIPKTTGDWIACLCDDDLLLPTYLEAFSGAAQSTTEPACLYTGQMHVRADSNGFITEDLGNRMADRERGQNDMDRQIDYLQFIFNRPMWNRLCELYEGKPFPEGKDTANHADGIFMERAVDISKAKPVPGIHCFNRRTPLSKFCGA